MAIDRFWLIIQTAHSAELTVFSLDYRHFAHYPHPGIVIRFFWVIDSTVLAFLTTVFSFPAHVLRATVLWFWSNSVICDKPPAPHFAVTARLIVYLLLLLHRKVLNRLVFLLLYGFHDSHMQRSAYQTAYPVERYFGTDGFRPISAPSLPVQSFLFPDLFCHQLKRYDFRPAQSYAGLTHNSLHRTEYTS